MLTIEDCLELLDEISEEPVQDQLGNLLEITNSWDRRFINDIASHTRQNQKISTAQSEIVIKLINRYEQHLVARGVNSLDLSRLVVSPAYRQNPYVSTVMPREVRWAGDNLLVFRFKFNAGIVEDVKRLRVESPYSFGMTSFNRDFKVWTVSVNSENLDRVMDLIKRHNFNVDDTVIEYFLNAVNARGAKSSASLENGVINVTIKDDSFFDFWISSIYKLEK